MRIIDAQSGQDVHEGSILNLSPGYTYKILKIKPGLLRAKAVVQHVELDKVLELPLVVRWTHPNFFMQRVAFVPS